MALYLTDKHFEAFGRIVYNYASAEVGIKFAVCGMLHTPLHRGMLTLSTITATNLGNTAKSLALACLKPEWQHELTGLVSRWLKHNDLRIRVAHHRWRAGDRADSVKPVFWEVRKGRPELIGHLEDETDWTLEDLVGAANELAQVKDDINDFLTRSGLHAIIERYTSDNNKDND